VRRRGRACERSIHHEARFLTYKEAMDFAYDVVGWSGNVIPADELVAHKERAQGTVTWEAL
jgi:hypothetical protein